MSGPSVPRGVVVWLAVVALSVACSRPKPTPSHVDPAFTPSFDEELRLILIGDTGLDNPTMRSLREKIKAEKKDLIIVAGDLVYPVAPECPDGVAQGQALRTLEAAIGKNLRGLGAPVLLALGNHDVAHKRRDRAREACILDYAAKEKDLVMPGLYYVVNLGIGTLVVLNSNALDDAQALMVKQAFSGETGWKMLVGHHVLRTYHDKASEDLVLPWLKIHKLAPDLYLNGHAHLLQFGVYARIAAITSGATAKVRERLACPPACGAGQLFGQSVPGYAVIDLKRDRMDLTFKGADGKVLWRWTRER